MGTARSKRANPTMKLSRRNVLAGLGGLAVGGGALLGSGAFSSVEAQRTVEVNVITEGDIADDSVDVILKNVGDDGGSGNVSSPENPELGVSTGSGSGGPAPNFSPEDPTALFPDTTDTFSSGTPYTLEDNDVSLIENDVAIIFGTDGNALQPNSTVKYDELFALVNDDPGSSPDFNVEFETTRSDLLQDQSSPPNDTFDRDVNAGNSKLVDAQLNTGGSDENDTLTITISEL
jgi:hypothetical protein